MYCDKNIPEVIQDLRIWGFGKDFWRRRARRITVPETAMAVAKTTPCELSIGDMNFSLFFYFFYLGLWLMSCGVDEEEEERKSKEEENGERERERERESFDLK